MDKPTQKILRNWLKQQSKLATRWLYLTIMMGVIGTFAIVAQAACIAHILHQAIILQVDKAELIHPFIGLIIAIVVKAGANYVREYAGFQCGAQVKVHIRYLIIEKIRSLGPAYLQQKQAGSWATLILEQVEDMQEYYARYLPQMVLAGAAPLLILVVIFPQNWAAGLIFLLTAPLVPVFMVLVGRKAADANNKNFKALQRLSGHFFDRLQALTTIRLFHQAAEQVKQLEVASDVFRQRTMSVLKIAFLSSAVLEFFTSISIALIAVYFGFSFIGELNFGSYSGSITLFTGLFILILAPEYYQPLRDLGTYYHAKQQAIGAAESIVEFLAIDNEAPQNLLDLPLIEQPEITFTHVEVFTHQGVKLVGPLNFTIGAGKTTALVGESGAGKSTLINALLGFLPHTGEICINGTALNSIDKKSWLSQISWLGQNPLLIHGSIYDNLNLAQTHSTEQSITQALKLAYADEFVDRLSLEHRIEDRMGGLSVGQAQRIALARAILQNGNMWILDEPTASLDAKSESLILNSIATQTINRTTLLITHQIGALTSADHILVLEHGQVIQQGDFTTLSQQTGVFQRLLNDGNYYFPQVTG